MFGHCKKSASILTDHDTQMVCNDRRPVTICNTALSSRELHTVACGIDKKQEHDLEKLEKDNGVKSALFNLKDTVIYRIYYTEYGCHVWRYQNFD